MDVYFLRHASAGKKKLNPKQDEKRPLDAKGMEQAKLIGRVLSGMDLQLDAIVSSPLTRAFETASLVAKEIGFKQPIVNDESLRPDASYEEFLTMLRDFSRKKAIVVVGHNPTESEFLSLLVSDNGSPNGIELRKGAIAKVEVKDKKGSLVWLITPKVAQLIQSSATTSSRPKTSRK
jgi:phosphohistidine phosphatase